MLRDGRTHGRTDGRTLGRSDVQTDGQTDGLIDGQTDGRTDGGAVGRTDRRTDGWSDAGTEGYLGSKSLVTNPTGFSQQEGQNSVLGAGLKAIILLSLAQVPGNFLKLC
jgi:hypothetical protein